MITVVVFVVIITIVGFLGLLFYAGSTLIPFINRTPLQDVTVGQCFNGGRAPVASSSGVVFGVDIVACTEPHTSEMAASLLYPGGAPGVAYPGLASVSAFAEQECRDSFADYVGVSFEESELEMTFVYPFEQNWRFGDYSIQCIVHPPVGQEQTSESYRNSRL